MVLLPNRMSDLSLSSRLAEVLEEGAGEHADEEPFDEVTAKKGNWRSFHTRQRWRRVFEGTKEWRLAR